MGFDFKTFLTTYGLSIGIFVVSAVVIGGVYYAMNTKMNDAVNDLETKLQAAIDQQSVIASNNEYASAVAASRCTQDLQDALKQQQIGSAAVYAKQAVADASAASKVCDDKIAAINATAEAKLKASIDDTIAAGKTECEALINSTKMSLAADTTKQITDAVTNANNACAISTKAAVDAKQVENTNAINAAIAAEKNTCAALVAKTIADEQAAALLRTNAAVADAQKICAATADSAKAAAAEQLAAAIASQIKLDDEKLQAAVAEISAKAANDLKAAATQAAIDLNNAVATAITTQLAKDQADLKVALFTAIETSKNYPMCPQEHVKSIPYKARWEYSVPSPTDVPAPGLTKSMYDLAPNGYCKSGWDADWSWDVGQASASCKAHGGTFVSDTSYGYLCIPPKQPTLCPVVKYSDGTDVWKWKKFTDGTYEARTCPNGCCGMQTNNIDKYVESNAKYWCTAKGGTFVTPSATSKEFQCIPATGYPNPYSI